MGMLWLYRTSHMRHVVRYTDARLMAAILYSAISFSIRRINGLMDLSWALGQWALLPYPDGPLPCLRSEGLEELGKIIENYIACDKKRSCMRQEHDHLLWCLSSWAPTPPAISHLLLVLRLIEHDILN